MIAYLEGTLKSRGTDHLIVSVGGVGYHVFVTPSIAEKYCEINSVIELHIHTHVREDQIALYGFPTPHELRIFQRLINVQGIGPKLALGVLSGLPANDFVSAVVNDDLTRLNAISGVGKKTAERIILDLKDRLIKDGMVTLPVLGATSAKPTVSGDAISALVNLGYNRQEAERALISLGNPADMPISQLIKAALKELAKS